MSVATIAPYFPFRRIKIIKQQVLPGAHEARIQVQPDKRFLPICQCCGQKATGIHSWTQRTVVITSYSIHYTKLYDDCCPMQFIKPEG